MSRVLVLKFLRGIKANIPILNIGEPYFETDTNSLIIGTDAQIDTPVYNVSGIRQQNPHIVAGRATVPSNGTLVVTLTGSAIFTSATSFICVAVDMTAKNRSPQATQNSGSQITFVANASDMIQFIMIGN